MTLRTRQALDEQDRRLRERMRASVRSRMFEQGISGRELARRAGIDERCISSFRTGKTIPDQASLSAIADALDLRDLVAMGESLRTGQCAVCGAVRVGSRSRPLFCGKACRDVGGTRRRRMGYGFQSIAVVKHRLGTFQLAVTAMCRSCEPEGVCHDRSCALRPVSALPLAATAARVA